MSEPQPESGLLKPYQLITTKIIQMLDGGVVPWRKPWLDTGRPTNLASGKAYRGINTFMLSMCGAASGYSSSYWLTYNQATERGGHVKKGEKSTPVVFWKLLERRASAGDDDDSSDGDNTAPAAINGEKARKFPVLKHFYVFNVEQCSGIEYPKPQVAENPFSPIEACEQIVQQMPRPPSIQHGESRAYYSPPRDLVNMPRPELFNSTEEYYATLFHELAHATGHPTRLNRESIKDASPFGTATYAKEELIAEMTATFLCSRVGIDQVTIENAASYINGWLTKLRSDPKLVVLSAAAAQKASDYILAEDRALTNEAIETEVARGAGR